MDTCKCPDCNGEGSSWHRMDGRNVRAQCFTCEGEGEVGAQEAPASATPKNAALPAVSSTDWLERIRQAMQAIEHRGAMPFALAVELQTAHTALRAAEQHAKRWGMRSNAADEMRH